MVKLLAVACIGDDSHTMKLTINSAETLSARAHKAIMALHIDRVHVALQERRGMPLDRDMLFRSALELQQTIDALIQDGSLFWSTAYRAWKLIL